MRGDFGGSNYELHTDCSLNCLQGNELWVIRERENCLINRKSVYLSVHTTVLCISVHSAVIFRPIKSHRLHTNYKWNFCGGLKHVYISYVQNILGTDTSFSLRGLVILQECSLSKLSCIIFSKFIRFCSVVLCSVTQSSNCPIDFTSWNRAVWKKHINPSRTKRRLLYLKTQSVPRCKHFSSRL